MRSIAEKSTGQLVDEAVTTAFRFAERRTSDNGLSVRCKLLVSALDARLGEGVGLLIFDIAAVLRATWVAQEVVMADSDDHTTAVAARQAQRLNAHRSRLVQRLDQLLGEDGITVMTKTYDRTAK